MSGYAERIAELAHRVTGIDLRLKAIDEERVANSVEASQNGTVALKKIASLDAEADQLRRSKETLSSAADQFDAQLKEEEAAAAAGLTAERAAKAKKIGSGICAVQSEIDLMLVQLREAFERREQMINELHRGGGIDLRTSFRLASRENATAAAYHARLNRFLNLEPMGPQQTRALSE